MSITDASITLGPIPVTTANIQQAPNSISQQSPESALTNDASFSLHKFISLQNDLLYKVDKDNVVLGDQAQNDGNDVMRKNTRSIKYGKRDSALNPKEKSQALPDAQSLYTRNDSIGKMDDASSHASENGSHVLNASLVNLMWSSTAPLPIRTGKDNNKTISTHYLVIFSTLFFLVGTVGISGNALVIYIVLSDGKMRRSMTNILILNLALADSITILFGIPEIVMFTLDRGWQLGPIFCSLNRSVMVCALYASVLILVAVCIERYIAIVFPIKAHILCTKKRIILVIIVIWILSILCATPTAIFNTVVKMADVQYCITKFHSNRTQHDNYFRIFKYSESAMFYVGPLIIQVICYAVIGKRLFVGLDKLHRTGGGISSASRPNGRGPARALNEAIRARKGVVKMLMASVAIYFISYSPHQILLVYKTFSNVTFDETWIYLVLTNTLAYINSAANPLMYCVFSDNFRTKFKLILASCFPCKACMCTCCLLCPSAVCRKDSHVQRPITLHSYTEYTTLVRRNTQRQGQAPIVAV